MQRLNQFPKQVEVKLDDENEKSPDNAPGEMMDIDPDACCPSTGKPQELQFGGSDPQYFRPHGAHPLP